MQLKQIHVFNNKIKFNGTEKTFEKMETEDIKICYECGKNHIETHPRRSPYKPDEKDYYCSGCFRNMCIDQSPIFSGSKKYFPALYQSMENLELLFMKRFDRNKYDKFSKDQIMRITGISELDLNVTARKDLRGI